MCPIGMAMQWFWLKSECAFCRDLYRQGKRNFSKSRMTREMHLTINGR